MGQSPSAVIGFGIVPTGELPWEKEEFEWSFDEWVTATFEQKDSWSWDLPEPFQPIRDGCDGGDRGVAIVVGETKYFDWEGIKPLGFQPRDMTSESVALVAFCKKYKIEHELPPHWLVAVSYD
jgi:hypothetical protein